MLIKVVTDIPFDGCKNCKYHHQYFANGVLRFVNECNLFCEELKTVDNILCRCEACQNAESAEHDIVMKQYLKSQVDILKENISAVSISTQLIEGLCKNIENKLLK